MARLYDLSPRQLLTLAKYWNLDQSISSLRLGCPLPFAIALLTLEPRIMMIRYQVGNDLDIDVVIELYQASTLGERRPIDNRDRMTKMIRNANLVVSAWDADLMIGIARAISDFSFATYLSDLAVRKAYQNQGIGKELIRRTQIESGEAKIILLAAPTAEKYYPRIGFTHHPQAWILLPGQSIL